MLLSGNLQGVQHIGIPTSNIELTMQWYKNNLGFEIVHEKVIADDKETVKAAFLRLGGLIIETYQSDFEDKKCEKSIGAIDHFAIKTSNIETVYEECFVKDILLPGQVKEGSTLNETFDKYDLSYFHITGPNNEKIEICRSINETTTELTSDLQGWCHLGIRTDNIERSAEFYSKFGFKKVLDNSIKNSENTVEMLIMEKQGFKIELCRPTPNGINMLKYKNDGFIDHIALNVIDINKAYEEIKYEGFEILEDGPTFLPFWENGVKFFTIRGPEMEKIEFNQKL